MSDCRVEPAEHRTRAGEFRRHVGVDVWGWKLGISQKNEERKGGRDGMQKHRAVERRREGGASTALLCIITY